MEKKPTMATTSLDKELWRACAGRTVSVLKLNSHVCYFPQGHAENAVCSDELAASLGLPPLLPCRVAAVKLEVDKDTDEVFERIRLVPLRACEENRLLEDGVEGSSSAAGDVPSHGKVLTQSDANNGGGFSVPRNCADAIFPALDYNAEPPVQLLCARDAHGKKWEFRHIYRGTPRRHLLTSGWSTFVNKKSLVARDMILFVKKSDREIGVGIRRGQRRDRRSRAEEFMKAVKAAVKGDEFEVLYYPREGASEFCVKTSAVKEAGGKGFSVNSKVKICVEDEVASRVKSCSGTVEVVRAFDSVHWPTSPWRILQVRWDDGKDTHQNLQHVSPWMIEAVEGTSMYSDLANLPFSLPRKRLQLPEFPQFPGPLSIAEPHNGSLRIFTNNTPATSIQGARHFPSGISIPEIPLEYIPIIPQPMNNSTITGVDAEDCSPITDKPEKKDYFLLFGKKIPYPQQQASPSNYSSDVVDAGAERENSVENGPEITAEAAALPCSVIMESKCLGLNINLTLLRSYEDLYNILFDVFNVKRFDLLRDAIYQNDDGLAFNLTEDLPFSDFANSARKLVISAPSNTENDTV